MREALLAMRDENYVFNHMITGEDSDNEFCTYKVRDITKLSGYPPSNVKTRLERLCFKTITWDEIKRNENI